MKEDSACRGWAIIGLGKHADAYLAPAIQKASGARLVAVCSRDKARAEAFASRHGAERSYCSFEQLLSDPAVEVVVIATPNSLHADQTVAAARAGKHVLCEKPMAVTASECERMIEACRSHGVKLGVDFQNRHHPAHQEARRIIASGAVGDITYASAQYAHGKIGVSFTGWRADPEMSGGGGSLYGAGLHSLDLLRFLIGKEVEEVTAVTDVGQQGRVVDETVLTILKFGKGTFGYAASGLHIPRSCNDLVVYGTKARITGTGTVGMQMLGELRVDADGLVARTEFPVADPVCGSYIHSVEAFSRNIDEDTEPNASGLDGLAMVRVAQAVLESSRSGKAVRLAS
jgi:1,5-anhydro-D-fructose reductase (1,5-anhydro-D-mannitol-forming)